jgi:hypothetical protein
MSNVIIVGGGLAKSMLGKTELLGEWKDLT